MFAGYEMDGFSVDDQLPAWLTYVFHTPSFTLHRTDGIGRYGSFPQIEETRGIGNTTADGYKGFAAASSYKSLLDDSFQRDSGYN